ncbi:hypothetical protein INT46_009071, partial [Mucor plumbeus]
VDINGFRTSKVSIVTVCNSCKNKELKPKKLCEQKYFQDILDCKLCHILWGQDINASKNIWVFCFLFGRAKEDL